MGKDRKPEKEVGKEIPVNEKLTDKGLNADKNTPAEIMRVNKPSFGWKIVDGDVGTLELPTDEGKPWVVAPDYTGRGSYSETQFTIDHPDDETRSSITIPDAWREGWQMYDFRAISRALQRAGIGNANAGGGTLAEETANFNGNVPPPDYARPVWTEGTGVSPSEYYQNAKPWERANKSPLDYRDMALRFAKEYRQQAETLKRANADNPERRIWGQIALNFDRGRLPRGGNPNPYAPETLTPERVNYARQVVRWMTAERMPSGRPPTPVAESFNRTDLIVAGRVLAAASGQYRPSIEGLDRIDVAYAKRYLKGTEARLKEVERSAKYYESTARQAQAEYNRRVKAQARAQKAPRTPRAPRTNVQTVAATAPANPRGNTRTLEYRQRLGQPNPTPTLIPNAPLTSNRGGFQEL